MTVISVSYTAKSAPRLAAGQPITTGLKNDEWDNMTFLMEWLGADYLAGAVQNHDHDGVNSAPIEALPNLVKNGSFERDGGGGVPAGWTFTPYTGGSAAMVTASQAHGKTCVGITSTVLANGGGYYESANFIDVGGGEDYLWKIWRNASAANISSKAEVVWYDAAEAQISVTTLFNLTNTETAFTEARGRTTAPATARLAKLRLTGGVPAAGSAVGTVYFDGVMVPDFPRIEQSAIQSAAVGQSQLKTAWGVISTTTMYGVDLVLAGGEHGFFPRLWAGAGAGSTGWGWNYNTTTATRAGQTNSGSPVTTMTLASGNTGWPAYAGQRYVQASPPYNMGDGEIGRFIFVVVDSNGRVECVYSAPEAPWHNNGPTDIRADYYDANNRGWRSQDITDTTWSWSEEAQMLVPMTHVIGRETIEITQAIKQADMALIPHPFLGNDLTGKTVVLLDPVAALTWHLAEMHEQGESPNSLLHDGYLRIDNAALNRAGPPGVMVVSANWRNTQ